MLRPSRRLPTLALLLAIASNACSFVGARASPRADRPRALPTCASVAFPVIDLGVSAMFWTVGGMTYVRTCDDRVSECNDPGAVKQSSEVTGTALMTVAAVQLASAIYGVVTIPTCRARLRRLSADRVRAPVDAAPVSR